MKFKEGFKMRVLGDDHILVPEGLGLVNFNKMIVLNSSANYLWEAVHEKEFSVEDLKNLLLEHYDVDEQTAGADSQKIASSWIEAGVVEE